MNFLSCILFFYLSEVSLLFDDVFLLQAKKIELWKIEKREQPHLLQQSSETRHRGPTHFLSGMKNVVRRLLGLWKLKKITANMKYMRITWHTEYVVSFLHFI